MGQVGHRYISVGQRWKRFFEVVGGLSTLASPNHTVIPVDPPRHTWAHQDLQVCNSTAPGQGLWGCPQGEQSRAGVWLLWGQGCVVLQVRLAQQPSHFIPAGIWKSPGNIVSSVSCV